MRCLTLLIVLAGALLSAPPAALAQSPAALAQRVTIPVNFKNEVIEKILQSHLFSATENGADIFSDSTNCNVLNLKNPRVSGTAEGHLLLTTDLSTRGGSPLGGRCIPLFGWQGDLTSTLAPYIAADGTRLGFNILQSTVSKGEGSQSAMPGIVWDWVKAYVHPELERTTIDLKPMLSATRDLIETAAPGAGDDASSILDTVAFTRVVGSAEGVMVELQLTLPETAPLASSMSTDVFSEAEVAQWDAAWQSWDAFITWLIKDLADQLGDSDPQLVRALATSLLEARYDLRRALVEKNLSRDPVRELFVKTWERLTPLLRQQLEGPAEMEALKYLTFIGAGDALVAVDGVADSLSLSFDSATFRSLARLISTSVTDEQLSYSTAVDPELRSLLGLPPQFDDEPDSLERLWNSSLSLLIPRAHAAAVDPKLVDKLTDWVPARTELDTYLAAVNLLLDTVVDAEREKDKVPQPYLDIYETLVYATAWQESCWRQYEKRGGQVTPLRSSAGSVGLMQVNQYVWRGVYDPEQLVTNIAYNARAGNEILVHYLVDYAIKNREHELTGDKHSLARAAYAIYNGGPRHRSRYRIETTGVGLKKIDSAFWSKYRAIQKEGVSAVKSCYGE